MATGAMPPPRLVEIGTIASLPRGGDSHAQPASPPALAAADCTARTWESPATSLPAPGRATTENQRCLGEPAGFSTLKTSRLPPELRPRTCPTTGSALHRAPTCPRNYGHGPAQQRG